MKGFVRTFANLYRMICVLILIAMVLLVFVNALMRYTMHSGFIATEEILRYLFIYMTFLGVVEVANARSHIAVTIVTDFLHGRVRTAVYVIGYLLILYAMYVLLEGTLMYWEDSDTSVGQVTGLPFRIIIASLFFGAAGMLVFTLRDLILGLKALRTGEEFPPKLVDEDVENAIEELAKQEEKK